MPINPRNSRPSAQTRRTDRERQPQHLPRELQPQHLPNATPIYSPEVRTTIQLIGTTPALPYTAEISTTSSFPQEPYPIAAPAPGPQNTPLPKASPVEAYPATPPSLEVTPYLDTIPETIAGDKIKSSDWKNASSKEKALLFLKELSIKDPSISQEILTPEQEISLVKYLDSQVSFISEKKSTIKHYPIKALAGITSIVAGSVATGGGLAVALIVVGSVGLLYSSLNRFVVLRLGSDTPKEDSQLSFIRHSNEQIEAASEKISDKLSSKI